MVGHGNYASIDNIKSMESWWNYFIFRVETPNVYTTRWELLECPSICLPKAMALRQETRAVCENQLTFSHQFMGHLKRCYTQISDRPLLMPVDEKDTLRKIASSRKGAVLVNRCADDCADAPFMAELNLAELEGWGQLTRLEVSDNVTQSFFPQPLGRAYIQPCTSQSLVLLTMYPLPPPQRPVCTVMHSCTDKNAMLSLPKTLEQSLQVTYHSTSNSSMSFSILSFLSSSYSHDRSWRTPMQFTVLKSFFEVIHLS